MMFLHSNRKLRQGSRCIKCWLRRPKTQVYSPVSTIWKDRTNCDMIFPDLHTGILGNTCRHAYTHAHPLAHSHAHTHTQHLPHHKLRERMRARNVNKVNTIIPNSNSTLLPLFYNSQIAIAKYWLEMALITNTPRTTMEREAERNLPRTGTPCSTYVHPSLEKSKQNEQQQQMHRLSKMSWKHPYSKISTSLGYRGSSEDNVLAKQAWGTEFYPQIPEAGVGGDTSYDSRAVEAERHIDHWAYWTANLWLTNPRLQWENLSGKRWKKM